MFDIGKWYEKVNYTALIVQNEYIWCLKLINQYYLVYESKYWK